MSENLQHFDFNVSLGANEHTFDFNDLVNTPLIEQDEQEPVLDFDFFNNWVNTPPVEQDEQEPVLDFFNNWVNTPPIGQEEQGSVLDFPPLSDATATIVEP